MLTSKQIQKLNEDMQGGQSPTAAAFGLGFSLDELRDQLQQSGRWIEPSWRVAGVGPVAPDVETKGAA